MHLHISEEPYLIFQYCFAFLVLFSVEIVSTTIASAQTFQGTTLPAFFDPFESSATYFISNGTQAVPISSLSSGSSLSDSTSNQLILGGTEFEFEQGGEFNVSNFVYFNGVTTTGTNVSKVPVGLNIDFFA
ncbi:MAG: choice-of-anchor K domain-containing protein, partial [Planctomycetota bacterium]